MLNNNSPVEYLVAFSVTFVAGALSLFAAQKWTEYVKNKAKEL